MLTVFDGVRIRNFHLDRCIDQLESLEPLLLRHEDFPHLFLLYLGLHRLEPLLPCQGLGSELPNIEVHRLLGMLILLGASLVLLLLLVQDILVLLIDVLLDVLELVAAQTLILSLFALLQPPLEFSLLLYLCLPPPFLLPLSLELGLPCCLLLPQLHI